MYNIPAELSQELCEDLLKTDNVRIEKIVSRGHKSAPDFWYDQVWDEWVLILDGHAILEFVDEEPDIELQKGQYMLIPAHKKHRVKWTDPNRNTIWLAVHYS